MQQISPAELEIVIVSATFAIGYAAYYSVFHSARVRAWFAARYEHDRSETLRNLFYRALMVLGFGIVPAILLSAFGPRSLADYGLVLVWDTGHAAITAGLSVVVVVVIRINPGRNKLIGMYPQMRIESWLPRHVAVNALGWAAYLFAYELMFRGFLLHALLPYGVVVALSVNTLLYVAVHVPKGLSEAIAAIPFGLLVCYLSLEFGTIWPAFFLHLALALANSFVAIAENPRMRITPRGRETTNAPSGRSDEPNAEVSREGATATDA